MKKWIFLILFAFAAYSTYQRNAERQREKLFGVWAMEQNFEGGWGKAILNLKPDGNATVDISATVMGRMASREGFGTWKYSNSTLAVTFTRGDVLPLLKAGGYYGGRITTLDDRSLSYRGNEGVETWTRIR